jgi:hypothetical protein
MRTFKLKAFALASLLSAGTVLSVTSASATTFTELNLNQQITSNFQPGPSQAEFFDFSGAGTLEIGAPPNRDTMVVYNVTSTGTNPSLEGSSSAGTSSDYTYLTGTHYVEIELLNAGEDPPVTLEFASAVPEPSTWAMMILGFFGVGFIAYRRKSVGPTLRIA